MRSLGRNSLIDFFKLRLGSTDSAARNVSGRLLSSSEMIHLKRYNA